MDATELTRIDPLSAGRVLGLMYFGGAILFIVPLGLLAMAQGDAPAFGLGFLMVLPLFYGAFGALFGALLAFIYNVAASAVGGLRLTLSE